MYVGFEFVKRFMDRLRIAIDFVCDNLVGEQSFPALVGFILGEQIILTLDAGEGEQIGNSRYLRTLDSYYCTSIFSIFIVFYIKSFEVHVRI